MNRYYRDSLVHGVLVFLDSFIVWLGMWLFAVGCVGSFLSSVLFSVGAFLIGTGAFLTVVELRAFLRGEYEQRGPIGPLPSESEHKGEQIANADKRRFQFGLRTLFLVIWFTSLVLSWWYCIPAITRAVNR